MELLTIERAGTPSHGEGVFREARISKFVILLVLLGILAGMVYAWRTRGLHLWVLLVFGGFLALIFWGVASMIRRTFGPENWTLRLEGRTLFVKFRSYQNDHFADDEPAVVAIRDEEIEWAGAAVEKTITRDNDNSTRVERVKCLDLRLRDGLDLRPLETALAGERAHPLVGNSFSRSKSHHTPAWLVDTRTLRIAWRGNGSCLKPNLAGALKALSAVVRVDAEQRHETHDFTGPSSDQSDGAVDEKVRQLARRGRVMDATRVARRATGGSLADARDRVDEAGG